MLIEKHVTTQIRNTAQFKKKALHIHTMMQSHPSLYDGEWFDSEKKS